MFGQASKEHDDQDELSEMEDEVAQLKAEIEEDPLVTSTPMELSPNDTYRMSLHRSYCIFCTIMLTRGKLCKPHKSIPR